MVEKENASEIGCKDHLGNTQPSAVMNDTESGDTKEWDGSQFEAISTVREDGWRAWAGSKDRHYWADTWVSAFFELLMWTTAYATAITANKFIQIPLYKASLATQGKARAAAALWSSFGEFWNATKNKTWDTADIQQTGWAKRPFNLDNSGVWGWWKNRTWINATGHGCVQGSAYNPCPKDPVPFDSLALNFIGVKNQGGLSGLAAFDSWGTYFGTWLALLIWYMVLCVIQSKVLDTKLRIKKEGGQRLGVADLVQIRGLDCVVSSTNFCTANFTYLLLISSLQFIEADAAWNILRPGNYLDAGQGFDKFNMFYVMNTYFLLAFLICLCLIELCELWNTYALEKLFGYSSAVAKERAKLLSTAAMGCWGWFCGIALTMAQQVLLTHKYLDWYQHPEAWVVGSFLVLAFYIVCTYAFRVTQHEIGRLKKSDGAGSVEDDEKVSAVSAPGNTMHNNPRFYSHRSRRWWLQGMRRLQGYAQSSTRKQSCSGSRHTPPPRAFLYLCVRPKAMNSTLLFA